MPISKSVCPECFEVENMRETRKSKIRKLSGELKKFG